MTLKQPRKMPSDHFIKKVHFFRGNGVLLTMRNIDPDFARWFEKTRRFYFMKLLFYKITGKDHTRDRRLDICVDEIMDGLSVNATYRLHLGRYFGCDCIE